MTSTEMRGFVFSLVFIIVFATLLSSIPADFQGTGSEVETVIPVDPSLVSGFADSENYTPAAFSPYGDIYQYEYTLEARVWVCQTNDSSYIGLSAKVLIWGGIWLGQYDVCKFTSASGTDRGNQLTFTEIDADDTEGGVRYSLQLTTSGDSAGYFVVYWNDTAYSNFVDAWNADEAYLLHGFGFESSATTNIGALIVSLLLLQLPDVPVLINVFLAVPVWACIVYVLWYVIKEMIPFL